MSQNFLELANFAGFSKRIDLASNSKGRKIEYEILWRDDGTTINRYFVTVASGLVYQYESTELDSAIEAYNVF